MDRLGSEVVIEDGLISVQLGDNTVVIAEHGDMFIATLFPADGFGKTELAELGGPDGIIKACLQKLGMDDCRTQIVYGGFIWE